MDVADPWSESVDVADTTPADFESRTTSVPIPQTSDPVHRLVVGVADWWDVTPSVAIDRALRVYLAHLTDTHDLSLRADYDVTMLIPPAGWVADQEWPTVALADTVPDDPVVQGSVPPTVKDMVLALTEDSAVVNYWPPSTVATAALLFVSGRDPDAARAWHVGDVDPD